MTSGRQPLWALMSSQCRQILSGCTSEAVFFYYLLIHASTRGVWDEAMPKSEVPHDPLILALLWVWFQHLPTLQASFVETSFKSSLNIAVLQTAFKNLCGVFYRQRFGKSMKMGARAQKGLRPSKSCINKNSAKNIKESHAFHTPSLKCKSSGLFSSTRIHRCLPPSSSRRHQDH